MGGAEWENWFGRKLLIQKYLTWILREKGAKKMNGERAKIFEYVFCKRLKINEIFFRNRQGLLREWNDGTMEWWNNELILDWD